MSKRVSGGVARFPRVPVGNGREVSRSLRNGFLPSKKTAWVRSRLTTERLARDGSGSPPYTPSGEAGCKKGKEEKIGIGGHST